jgi:hypothetical protein
MVSRYLFQCEAAIGKRCTNEKGEAVTVHAEQRALSTRSKLGNVGWHTFRHTYRCSWMMPAHLSACSRN